VLAERAIWLEEFQSCSNVASTFALNEMPNALPHG